MTNMEINIECYIPFNLSCSNQSKTECFLYDRIYDTKLQISISDLKILWSTGCVTLDTLDLTEVFACATVHKYSAFIESWNAAALTVPPPPNPPL